MRISRVMWGLGMVAIVAGVVWAQEVNPQATNRTLEITTEPVGGAVGYDPTIGTVQDGVVGDVRATVSEDRRYVQLDMHPTISTVIAIDNFLVVTD